MSELPIGEVPDGWRVARLGDVCSKIGSGATPRGGAAVYLADGTAFIRSQNVYDNEFSLEGLVYIDDDAAEQLKGVQVKRGDVLLNITGDSILRTCSAPQQVLPARVSQHVAIIRPESELDSLFLQKYLTLPAVKEYMLGHSAGGTRKAITKGHIESFLVPVPPFDEQRAIAGVLGALDDKIESNRRIAMGCVQFLAAVAGLGPSDSYVPLAALADAVRDPIDPQALGELVVDHFSIPAFDAWGLPERCLASTILSGKFTVSRRSVLVSRLNPATPRVWLAEPGGRPAMCSTEFLVLEPKGDVPLAAVWLAAVSGSYTAEAERRATGTSYSHQRIKPNDAMSIQVPDMRLVDENLLDEADAWLERALRARQESATARALRDALLPELLSGRLRVIDVEDRVGAVL